MIFTPRCYLALIAVSAFLLASVSASCIPKKLPTSVEGRSGLPTGIYDPGTPPAKWDVALESLPLYPGSKQFGSKYNFITTDPLLDVFQHYKEKLPAAEIIEGTNKRPAVIFKTVEFILEIGVDEGEENTIIKFKEPEE